MTKMNKYMLTFISLKNNYFNLLELENKISIKWDLYIYLYHFTQFDVDLYLYLYKNFSRASHATSKIISFYY